MPDKLPKLAAQRLDKAGLCLWSDIAAGLEDGSVSCALKAQGTAPGAFRLYQQVVDALVEQGYDVARYRNQFVSGVGNDV